MDLLSLDEAQLLKLRADAQLHEAMAWIATPPRSSTSGVGGAGPAPGTPREKQHRQKLVTWRGRDVMSRG